MNFKLINKVLAYFGVIGIVLMVLMISGAVPTKDQRMNATNAMFTSVALPDELNFAGERIPLENFDVRESLDKELLVNTYWHSQTFLLIKRANRFFPEIEPILKRNGIPDDFKYLALAESGLTNVVSPAGAAGFWQFVKQTAIDYGMEVNDEVDERYSIEESTEAACKFIKHSYEIYKSWTMAAASYNMGRTGLNKQIARQYSKNYYDILLNEETSRYVYRIAALKAIILNKKKK
ncbi:MAG TPA: lytic transglycosylase domain-containing protein, partial [Bacteroidales bacterium]|nr:lytic transglycosylase domain-containing protein [Bacteroidales bacterium]